MAETTRLIEAVLQTTPAAALLERGFALASDPGSIAFRALFAGVSRRLGGAAAERIVPPAAVAALARPHWTLTDWTRLVLVARAAVARPLGEQPALVLRIYEAGEIGEQESVLRTLGIVPVRVCSRTRCW